MSTPTYKPFAWTPLTVATAYIPRPPTRYVIDELFEAGSLNVVYGAPGSLKSLLLVGCLRVCRGRRAMVGVGPRLDNRGEASQLSKARRCIWTLIMECAGRSTAWKP
jgi:hypothetical protein